MFARVEATGATTVIRTSNVEYVELWRAGQLESETAQFQLADPGSPTMVKDDSDEGALYVLMPMRV